MKERQYLKGVVIQGHKICKLVPLRIKNTNLP